MEGPPLQLLAEWSALLLDGLASAGVRDVVVSPGSRSTPFVLAASRHPALRCRDVVDERSAAFFALGLARATGRPPLLLCTSGTAPAHYYPAIIEAAEAFVPLLVLTADRPLDLQRCGAPQTIDQVKLFGDHVRRFVDLGLPDATPGALRSLRRSASQAVLDALWPTPGPVHLNARARKPLEPGLAGDDVERAASAAARALAKRAPPQAHVPRLEPAHEALDALAEVLRRAERPLLVAGPAPIAQRRVRADVFALAARRGIPVLCDATSQLRFGTVPRDVLLCDASEHLLASRAFRSTPPDVVLQLGAPPTSSAWDAFVLETGAALHVVARQGWPDPTGAAASLTIGDAGAVARALYERLEPVTSNPWGRRVAAAQDAASRAVERIIERDGWLSEARVARSAAASLPEEGLLVVGNSLPIRCVDAYGRAGDARCRVVSQRGANGIDGFVSGAAGAASSGRPTVLLVGDVSFLHDLGGLAVARDVREPLAIVVVQNGGGRIFEQLPVARTASEAELRHFTTPHALSFAAAAELFEVPYRRVDDRVALEEALASALDRNGCTIIEAIVPPHGAAAMRAEVAAAVEQALATLTEAAP